MVKLRVATDCPINSITVGAFPTVMVVPGAEIEVPAELREELMAMGYFTEVASEVASEIPQNEQEKEEK